MPLPALGRLAAGVLTTTVLTGLVGCDDAGTRSASGPEYLDIADAAPLTEVLGDTAAVRALDETEEDRTTWLAKRTRKVSARSLNRLLAAPGVAPAAAPLASPTAAVRPVAATTVAPPSSRTVTRDRATTTHDSDAGPVTSTIDASTSVEDGAATSSRTVETTVGTPPAPTARSEIEVETTTDLCPEGDEITGEWSTEQTVEQSKDGVTVTITVRGHGTFSRTSEGTMSIPELTMTGSGASGTSSTGPIQVSGSVGAWEEGWRGDILAPAKLTQTGGARDAESAFLLPSLLLLNVQHALQDAARDSERRREAGACVRLEAEADKTALSEGESATVTVRVTDPTTGAEIPDAQVQATAYDGTSDETVTAPGTLTFTASGPEPRVALSVDTARGSDRVTLRFDVQGWSFEGVSYSAVTASMGIPMVTTWAGQVCGDPFTEPWQTRVTIESSVLSPTLEGEMVAADVATPPGGDRAWLLIQAVDEPAPGDPPFRLWVDDRDPAASPSHQRVEVTTLEPVKGACATR